MRSGSVDIASLPSLAYRQSVLLAELARMSDRLMETFVDEREKMKHASRTLTLARSSLDWILSIQSKHGDKDYETHTKAKIDSMRLVIDLLVRQASTVINIDGSSASNPSEALQLSHQALSLATSFSLECQKTKDENEAKLLLDTLCEEISHHLHRIEKIHPVVSKDTSLSHLLLSSCS
jgi:hypothetical protein